ncbi:MAG TPA: thiamine pyrophosphate-dependent enzyme [Anaerolineales bacterium]|nr:thiamine pyrophosphate-dependent enzyme [Anaerolineales bacterium]
MTEITLSPMDITTTPQEIIADYRTVFRSRQVSLISRREVMSGKAKFGIFGDGKELPQIAMAKVFHKGDFRSGYYRDQTFMFAIGALTTTEFFAQLYAHADLEDDPASAGRSMNAHFATRSLNSDGTWKDLTKEFNSTPDISPTGSQMPRLVGLAYASRLYREIEQLQTLTQFSDNGKEVAFGTIGNAATAEGMFWESVNAIGVLKAPALISIWDDCYGISVSSEHQLVKQDISKLLEGFQREPDADQGFAVYSVAGWDYPMLVEAYSQAAKSVRDEHIPAIVHVYELTQPQGHSTSGSHERYKSQERLDWEAEFDCLVKFREWVIEHKYASQEELDHLEEEESQRVEESRKQAWQNYISPIKSERAQVAEILAEIAGVSESAIQIEEIRSRLLSIPTPYRRDSMSAALKALTLVRNEEIPSKNQLLEWKNSQMELNEERYSSHLYSQSAQSALNVPVIEPVFSPDSPIVYGYEILNALFESALIRDPRIIAFGEDVGRLGDVNQGFRGLQDKFGELRVSDTGIREVTIIGQAIGMAMRGLRPIAEIQYLDYLLYGLQIMSDDLATLQWRTKGGTKAPIIIRTRGHRLEGIWHSGSPMSGIINLVRGMHVLVPRDMTRAAGFYNTLLHSDDPGLMIEVLNGYRLKEQLPDNVDEFTIPLGVPEVLRPGQDVSVVTYGATCRIALDAAERLSQIGIECEIIDVQTLLPFDVQQKILGSLKKTGRIIFVDEDVPGGTTAYMMQDVIERQGGYHWLDSPPRTLPGKPHRPAYGSDGDYWSKPNVDQVFEAIYQMMSESDPREYPSYF